MPLQKKNQNIIFPLLIVAGVYSMWCGFSYYGQAKLQKLEYKVIANITRSPLTSFKNIGHSNKKVEVRVYEPHVEVQAVYRGVEIDIALDMGLQDLGEYFMGRNSQLRKIDMALPIMIEKLPTLNAYLVSFVVPRRYNATELPEPLNKRLVIREDSSKTYAAKSWLGRSPGETMVDIKKQKLQKIIQNSNYRISGNMVIFQYDSPLTPAWMRRNQILFEIQQKKLLKMK